MRLGRPLTNEDKEVSSLESFYDFVFNTEEPTLFVMGSEIDFIDANSLGYSETILKKLGERIKEKDHRIISVFSCKYGLASESSYQRVAINKILDHATFYDLMRFDYDSLIFVPYGKDYACDFYRFRGGYSSLPDYAKRRVAIFSTNNFCSMIVADNLKLPWIYKVDLEFSEDRFKNFLNSFKSFSLKPDTTPVVFCFDIVLKKAFNESFNTDNIDIDFIIPTLGKKQEEKSIKKNKIKLRVKDGREDNSRKFRKKADK